MYRLIGLGLTLRLLEHDERSAYELYSQVIGYEGLSNEERKDLMKILEDELVHEVELVESSEALKDFLEHVRDAVLGMSDGLVEILSVVSGLAGAYPNPSVIALSGLIVGIAGSLSMGIEAFSSVRAQRHVRVGLLKAVSTAAKYVGHVLKDHVFKFMLNKGFSKEISRAIAEEAISNERLLTRLIAEERYGLREERLEEPLKSGLYTGLFYILSAMVPLIPYFIGLKIVLALPLSFVLASIMLALLGFIIAALAGLSIKSKALELVLAGLGSATATYLIGRLASILLGIEIT